MFLLTRQEPFGDVLVRDDALVELGDLVDERNFEMQARLVLGVDDLAADRLDRELPLVDREQARTADQNDRDQREQDVQELGLHQRTPRARDGSSGGSTCTSGIFTGATVIVSFGNVIDCGEEDSSLSSGR